MHSIRPSTHSHDPTCRRSRARLGALGCWLFALAGCDDGSVTSIDDEETESAAGPLDAGWDETTDAGLGTTEAGADMPGTPGAHAFDAAHAGELGTPGARGGGCEACWSCLHACDDAYPSCQASADYWKLMNERNCWYAYGWVCQYVEPGNDQDGVCINYNSCLISADLQYQWDIWDCGSAYNSCRDSGCWNDCLCKGD